jgi:hypothetical protein
MRSTLVLLIFLALTINSIAQKNFLTYDKETYDQYLKGDFKNLRKTSDEMLQNGIDYYYLRMRIGILSFNNQRYPNAIKHFTKALCFNSSDTVSSEYAYYSYLYSGRKADANLYLKSLSEEKKSKVLKGRKGSGFSEFFTSLSYSSFDPEKYTTNSLYYEAVERSLNASVGFESYFSSKFKAFFAYNYYNKTGTVYNSTNSNGENLDFSQNQLYAKFTKISFPGWEFAGFAHFAFYPDATKNSQSNGRRSNSNIATEYLAGISISKSGWKLRGGANFSYSNFAKSSQIRGEGQITYLPFGNLNLYFTTGAMLQTDNNWGNTYQVNQDIGFKVFKHLWFESGIASGNSFLYARNQGLSINNSFQIPSISIYSNLIVLLGNRVNLTLTPYYTQNTLYSWDLISHVKTDKLTLDSFGGSIKLTIKGK